MRMPKPRWLAVACLLSLAGCGQEEAPGGLPLAYAPVDTPYAIGNLEVIPDAVREAWWSKTETILSLYGPLMRKGLEEGKSKEGKEHPLAFALLEELIELDTRAEFEALGLDGKSRMALYGVGLLPVLRMELKDPTAAKALIARAEQKAGEKIPTAKLGQLEYYQGVAGPLEVALAITNGQLIFTAMPKAAPDAIKSQLLASAPPADNVISSNKLTQLNSSYGFLPSGSGYIDVQKVVSTILAPTGEVDRELFKALEVKVPELTAECRSEFTAMSAEAPRMAFGLTAMDAQSMKSVTVLELKPAIAKELSAIAAPIPALAAQAKWLGFGIGFNGPALAAFIDARAKAIAADPYKCADLADLDDELTKVAQNLSGATIYLGMAKGFAVAIDKLEMDFDAGKPKSLDATLLIASDNPQALYGIAATSLPPVAALNLEPNSEVKAIPLDQLPPDISGMGAAYAVMTQNALVARFAADDQGAGAVAATKLGNTEAGTLLTYNISGELYRLMGEGMRRSPSGPKEMNESMGQLFAKYADLFDHINTDVLLTARGIEFKQDLRMK